MARVTPPDETIAWTDEQIEREISRALPAGAHFVCEWQGDVWNARVEATSAGPAAAQHSAYHIDRRMALYDVYGALWLSSQANVGGAPVWSPAIARPSVASVAEYVRSRTADPADVDPVEVAAVYGIAPSKRREN